MPGEKANSRREEFEIAGSAKLKAVDLAQQLSALAEVAGGISGPDQHGTPPCAG